MSLIFYHRQCINDSFTFHQETDQQRVGTYQRGGEGTAFVRSLQRTVEASEELRLRTGSEGLSVRFEALKPHAYHSHLPLSDVPLKTLFSRSSLPLFRKKFLWGNIFCSRTKKEKIYWGCQLRHSRRRQDLLGITGLIIEKCLKHFTSYYYQKRENTIYFFSSQVTCSFFQFK